MAILASAIFFAVSIIGAAIPPLNLHGDAKSKEPEFPAPPGYLLPWPGGQMESITQGEETPFTHNGLAAYAFDVGMSYETIVASRGGRVSMLYEGSNIGGCDPALASAANYLVIDHGDGTSGLYLHLAYDSVLVNAGDIVAQGQAIAISGDTGVTCADDDAGSAAPHLHFQVQRTEPDHYFTQSLPVTFDDVPGDGVPVEGSEYASANYGAGRPQHVKLNVRRAQRVFNPTAVATDPRLAEADSVAPPPPGAVAFQAPEPPPIEAAPSAEVAIPTATVTPEPEASETPTRTPEPEATPTAAPTQPPPEPSPSPVPATEPPPTAAPDPTAPPATMTQAAATEPPATIAPPPPSETAEPTP